MVQDAKAVATNMRDQGSIKQWRDSNKKLLDSVGKVRKAVAGPDVVPPPDMSALSLSKWKKNDATSRLRSCCFRLNSLHVDFGCRRTTPSTAARRRASSAKTTSSRDGRRRRNVPTRSARRPAHLGALRVNFNYKFDWRLID